MGLEGVLLLPINHQAVSSGISINGGQSIDLFPLQPHAESIYEEEDTARKDALPASISLFLMIAFSQSGRPKSLKK